MAFEEIVGKTIIEVAMHEDYLLRFTLADGSFEYFGATGDCCNSVWFCHIEGVDRLIGAGIFAVEEKGWNQLETNDYDCLEAGFWTLSTTKGYVDIEVRNSHNGYYGGYVQNYDHLKKVDPKLDFKVLTEDF